MPPTISNTKPRTHNDSVLVVCAVCWKKPKGVRNITDKQADLIRQFSYKDYNIRNYFHPKVICGACRVTLSNLEKVGEYYILKFIY